MKKIFILFFVLISAFIFAENWIFEMLTIELPTGKAENEIYVYDTPDHLKDVPDEGPTKFDVDESGNIYILTSDRFNKTRINKYDESGKYLYSTKENNLIIHSFIVHQKMISTVCGDHQNNIFLRRFDDNCQLIDTYQIENRKSTLAVNQDGKVGLNLGNNNFLGFNFEESEISITNGKFLNDIIIDFSARERKQKVLFPEENIELDLHEIWPNEIGCSFINFDKNGNLYFNIYSEPRQDSSLGIISESGEVIETNIIFPHYTKFGLDFAKGISKAVTPDGTIYQMIPMKDKIEIRKWIKARAE